MEEGFIVDLSGRTSALLQLHTVELGNL